MGLLGPGMGGDGIGGRDGRRFIFGGTVKSGPAVTYVKKVKRRRSLYERIGQTLGCKIVGGIEDFG